jgi:uncharacterized DUF497 family protein
MNYEWDEGKRAANLAKHGIDFNDAADFDWSTAIETVDDRYDYGETRWVALGNLKQRLHVIIYTLRDDSIRIISLRKANPRERQYYETQTQQH